MHIILRRKCRAPVPSMGTEGLHHVAVAADGIGVDARLPLAAHEHRSVGTNLGILIRVDVDGKAGAVIAGEAVASPAITAQAVDRELLRPIIDLRENRFHIICNGAHHLNAVRSRYLLAAGKPPDRNLYPDHLLRSCLIARICSNPLILRPHLLH